MEKNIPTSELLTTIASRHTTGSVSIREITQTLHEKGFGLLLFTFAFPLIFPLIPGMSSILSLPLLFFSLQMALGRIDIYLPSKLADKEISAAAFESTLRKVVPWLQRIERHVVPRGEAIFTPAMDRLIGLFSFGLAGCIALPLSFVTNVIPAAGISLMALALLQRDRRMLLIGAVVGLVGLIISLLAVYAIIMSVLFLGSQIA